MSDPAIPVVLVDDRAKCPVCSEFTTLLIDDDGMHAVKCEHNFRIHVDFDTVGNVIEKRAFFRRGCRLG